MFDIQRGLKYLKPLGTCLSLYAYKYCVVRYCPDFNLYVLIYSRISLLGWGHSYIAYQGTFVADV